MLSVVIYFLSSKKSSVAKKGSVRSILAVGDSNTNANFSYADQLRQRFPGLVIKKIAQDGANSSWMKAQLEQELQNNKYDAISILGGSNDVYGGVNIGLTKYNLDSMYRLAHIKGSKVLDITPPNKDFYTQKTDQKQVALHELVDWIKGNRNIDFLIDFYTITNNKSFFASNDGYLHPQAGAHSILAQQVAQKLNLA